MRLRMLVTACTVIMVGAVSYAAVPTSITIQGKLTESSGTALPGSHNFALRIFDASSGGTQLWPSGGVGENQTLNADAAGLWIGLVGAVNPLNDAVFADTVRWLEITVDGTTLPRTRLVTSPYAQRVATIDGANGGALGSGIDLPNVGSTLNNNVAGLRWWNGSDPNTAYGFVSSSFGGLGYQAPVSPEGALFTFRDTASNGVLGVPRILIGHAGDISMSGNLVANGFIRSNTELVALDRVTTPGYVEAPTLKSVAPGVNAGMVVLDNGGDIMWENSVGTLKSVLTTHSDDNVYFDAAASNTSNLIIRNQTTLIERMRLNPSGFLGIGHNNPNYRVTLPDVADASGQGAADAWLAWSSRRWKTDIRPLEKALDKVERLQGVRYRKKTDGEEQIGLIAEDVGKVVPEVVSYEENGIDANAVDYARLTALLIEAVKEQQKQIDDLKSRLDRQTP